MLRRAKNLVRLDPRPIDRADIFYAGIASTAALPGDDSFLFLGLQDELVLSVPAGQAQWTKRELEEGMNGHYLDVPIRGTAEELGSSWSKRWADLFLACNGAPSTAGPAVPGPR